MKRTHPFKICAGTLERHDPADYIHDIQSAFQFLQRCIRKRWTHAHSLQKLSIFALRARRSERKAMLLYLIYDKKEVFPFFFFSFFVKIM